MSQIYGFRYFLMIIGMQTIFLTGKAEQALQVKGENKAAEDTSTQEVPTRFSYSIEDSLDRSNHFRQEQRDANGVVRGSYGFQNPEGAFRLVHYIADDKGFRAHVTSNEHGLGQQNPASVNINRFARKPSIQDEQNFIRPPFFSRQRNYNKVESQSFGNRDYSHPEPFIPAQPRPHSSRDLYYRTPQIENHPSKFGIFSDYRQSNPHYQMQYRYDRYSSERWNSRLGVPGEVISYIKDNDLSHYRRKSNVLSGFPLELDQILPSGDINSFTDSVKSIPENFEEKYSESYNKASNNSQEYGLNSRRGSSLESSFSLSTTHSPVLNILLSRPQHKVHKSLPDCGSVSSGVLCKPPIFPNGIYVQQNSADVLHKDILDTAQNLKDTTDSIGSNPNMKKISEILQRLSTETFPPHLIPKSFPLHSDIYKSFSDSKGYPKDFQKPSDLSLPCDEKSLVLDENELNLAPSLKKVYVYNTLSEDKVPHFQSNQEVWESTVMSSRLFTDILSKRRPIYNSHDTENHLAIRRNINKHDFLNNDKDLLYLPFDMVSDKPQKIPINLLANLNLIGVVLLPYKTNEKPGKDSAEDSEKLNPEGSHIRPLNTKKTNSSEIKNSQNTSSDIIQALLKHDKHIKSELFSGNILRESHQTIPKINLNSDVSEKIPFDEFNSNDKADTPALDDNFKNSEFLILDDTDYFESHSSEKPMEANRRNNTGNTSNWRKILEEELRKSLKETDSQEEARYHDIDPAIPSSLQNSDQRVYEINKPANPLFDSRGVQIKPENVPLHLHRFIPPSGITSLPWKFTIPRPAPPRSVDIPPKPPVLT